MHVFNGFFPTARKHYSGFISFSTGAFSKPLCVILLGVLLRIFLDGLLLRSGYFFGPESDPFSRAYLSWKWATKPYFYAGHWLPFQFWLTGLIYKLVFPISSSVELSVPIIVNHLFFIGSLSITYLIGYHFGKHLSATIAVLLAATLVGDIWVTLNALSEPLTIFFGLLIGYCLFRFSGVDNDKRDKWIILMGVSAFIASANHYLGWSVATLVAAVSLILFLRSLGNIQSSLARHSLVYSTTLVLALSFPIIWLVANFIIHDDPLFFLRMATYYHKDFAVSYDYFNKVFGPFMLAFNSSPLILTISILAIPLEIRKDRTRASYLAPISTYLLFIVVSSVVNWGMPYAYPRYMIIISWFSIPFVANWLSGFIKSSRTFTRISAWIILVLLLVSNTSELFEFNNWVQEDTRVLGAYLSNWIKKNPDDKLVMHESKGSWMDQAIDVISGRPDRIIFAESSQVILTIMSGDHPETENIGLYVIRDLDAISKVESKVNLVAIIGDYLVFEKTTDNNILRQKMNFLEKWDYLDSDQFILFLPADQIIIGYGNLDPQKGEVAGIVRRFELLNPSCHILETEVRDYYDVPTFPGRFLHQILIDDIVIWTHDISGDNFSGWQEIRQYLVSDAGEFKLSFRIYAIANTEPGWEWGKASRMAIGGIRIRPCE